MCGITGIFNIDKKPVNLKSLVTMTDLISHRGPDDEGYLLLNSLTGEWIQMGREEDPVQQSYYNLGFGHRRLSIIDLSPAGHQPMSNEDDTLWITYNGEIYNYMELISELKASGHKFKSNTDTEVILHSYEEWGEDCVQKFNGMWAFALWDSRKGIIFCSRDRFGIKPFYFYFNDYSFIFASEIKSILQLLNNRKPNEKVIYNYLYNSFGFMDIYDETFFKDIKRLMPANNLIIKNKELLIKKYWDITLDDKIFSKNDCVEQVREILIDSVRIRMRSDVKIGGALSGGIDSTSITCIIKKVLRHQDYDTYSACFQEKEFDEREYIEDVISDVGYKSNYVFPPRDKIFDTLKKQLWYQDEPFNALWVYSQWFVYECAANNGIKVFLNGHGSDELLGGYYPHFDFQLANYLLRFKLSTFIKELRAFENIHNGRKIYPQKIMRIIASHLFPDALKELFRFKPKFLCREFVERYAGFKYSYNIDTKDLLKRNLYESFFISPLPGMLHFDDRNSMAFSIESRPPFLDHRLVELSFGIPSEFKVKNGLNKYILREAMKDILTQKIKTRYDKKGFQSGARLWFKREQLETISDIFNSDSFKNRGYFNQKEVLKEFDLHVNGKTDIHEKLWSWIALELWFRCFIDLNERFENN